MLKSNCKKTALDTQKPGKFDYFPLSKYLHQSTGSRKFTGDALPISAVKRETTSLLLGISQRAWL
jgi:hypothetical protein